MKISKDRLSLSERQFQAMVENGSDVSILTDANGVIEYISPSCEQMFGKKQADLIGRSRLDYLLDEDRTILHDALQQITMKPGSSITTKLRWLLGDGTVRTFNCTMKNKLDDEAVGGIICSCCDSSQLQERTAELASSRATLKAVLDSSADAICSIGRDYRILSYNAKLQTIMKMVWGIDLREGMRLSENVSEDESAFWTDVQTQALRGEIVTAERVYKNAYGEAIVEFSLYPIIEREMVIGASVFGHDVTKERKAHEQIQFQANLLAQTGDIIVAADKEGLVTYWNAAAERRFGITADKAIGQLGRNFFKGWNCKDSYEKIGEDLASTGTWNGIFRLLGPEGLEGAFSMTVSSLKDGDDYVGSLWLSRDITKDELMEEELVRSEARYQQLFEESPSPMWVINTESLRFLHVNRAACELYGYTRDEFLNMTPLDLRSSEDKKTFLSEIAPKIRRPNDEISVMVRHVKKNGQSMDVLVRSHVIHSNGQNGRMALMEDVTDRLRAERQLVAANERFHLASEAVTSLIYELDVKTGESIRSHGLNLLLGFDPVVESETGTIEWWKSRIHPDDLEQANAAISDLRRDKQTYESEYRMLHKEGHWVFVWDRAIVKWDESGNPVRVIGSTQDITKRKSMEAELKGERNSALIAKERAEEMTRLKSSFLANMSHEIRTPMTAILGFAEILKERIENKVLSDHAETIESSAKRLLNTINTILDQAQIESRNINLSPILVDVNEEVRRICALLEPLASQRNVRFRFKRSPAAFEACLDLQQFDHIVTNLIGNAIKFTREGEVNVTVLFGDGMDKVTPLIPGFASYCIGKPVNADHFRIVVQDTGIGIAAKNLPIIFEEFRQESAGIHRNYEGTGLGLTIASHLVQMMGGSIEVRSALDVGSKFIVNLPVNLDGVTLTDQAKSKIIKPNVLIVEDSIETVKLVEAHLDERFDVTHVSSIAKARQKVKDIAPDLIFMDINLGEFTTGLELTAEFRRHKRLANIPIIALTAYAMQSDRDSALEAGCTDFLSKPFTRSQLLEVVDRYFPIQTIGNIALAESF
jgi:PAS domain S-box-containing protein